MVVARISVVFLLYLCTSSVIALDTLINAAARGNETRVRELLDNGDDVNYKNSGNETALHYAAAYGRVQIAMLLIEKGADPNIQDAQGFTPLIRAALTFYPHMNINMFRLLLEHGAEPNIQDKTGETALIHTIHGRRWSFENYDNFVRVLLAHEADPNIEASFKTTALSRAIYYHYENIVQMLLDNGADVNFLYFGGRTALILAATNNNENIVRMLLGKKADKNIRDSTGRTALDWAIFLGYTKIAEILQSV